MSRSITLIYFFKLLVVRNDQSCLLGSRCASYSKSLRLSLDDILRDQIKQNITLIEHSSLVKVSATLTMTLFITGVINSVLSFVTFHNSDARQVGSGIYLLASSITSFLTMCLFVLKFWFLVLTHTDTPCSSSVLRAGCVLIEPALRLGLYLDAWLNACVAIERAVAVSRGVKFNKQRSQSMARWIILLLPFMITVRSFMSHCSGLSLASRTLWNATIR